jgi:hypothetical protein
MDGAQQWWGYLASGLQIIELAFNGGDSVFKLRLKHEAGYAICEVRDLCKLI